MKPKLLFVALFGLLMVLAFYCHSQDAKVKLGGNLSASTIFYNADGITNRKDPFAYVLTGSLNLSAYNYTLPFSFTLSNRNSQFSQPFNQLGLSPQYKWIKFHLGYRNIRFAPFVLDGHTILGAGMELNPGKWRLGFIRGRFKKELNIARDIEKTVLDTLSTFSRNGYAIKLGFGTQETFFDITYLKASDDTLSIDPEEMVNSQNPASNAVLGLNSKVQLFDFLNFELSSAFSVYTENIGENLAPLDDQIKSVFLPPVNLSTKYASVIRSSINYHPVSGYSLSLKYLRVNPFFSSMGMYFIQDDVEDITLNTSFKILNKTLDGNVSLGTERNNLNGIRASTSRRWIGSANINYNPSNNFGINVSYANYSVNQHAEEVIIADSVKLYQSNRQFTLLPRYMLYGEKINHLLMLMFNYSGLKDKNPYSSEETEFNLRNLMLTYNAGFIQSGFGLTFNYTRSRVLMPETESKNQSVLLGVSKSLAKKKLQLRFNQLIAFTDNGNDKARIYRPSVSGTFLLKKNHRFRLQLFLKKNISEDMNFTESVADITYQYHFSIAKK